MSEKVAPAHAVEQGAQRGALFKLLGFSISLAVVPISSYFISSKYIWHDDHTYAAITAVVAANIVLVAYILSSVLEDQGDRARAETSKEQFESRKNR